MLLTSLWSFFLVRYEGLVLSVGGNGRSYVLILEAGPSADRSQSKLYFARFSTKVGFCRVRPSYFLVNCWILIFPIISFVIIFGKPECILHNSPLQKWQVRVPFSSFRPVKPDDPPMDPFLVHTMTIRFEPRRQVFPWWFHRFLCNHVNCLVVLLPILLNLYENPACLSFSVIETISAQCSNVFGLPSSKYDDTAFLVDIRSVVNWSKSSNNGCQILTFSFKILDSFILVGVILFWICT